MDGQTDPWKLESWEDADLLKCDDHEDQSVVDLEARKDEHPDAWSGPEVGRSSWS